MSRKRPENGTDPSWFAGGTAFLTVGAQLASTTIANASCIQKPVRPIALRSAFLWIERMVSGAEKRTVGLREKCRSWKATGKRRACPLRRSIFHGRSGLDGGSRLADRSRLTGGSKLAGRSKFGG